MSRITSVMIALAETLDRDAPTILKAIASMVPFHLVTFEIRVAPRPHRFSVHLKGADRKHTLLYTTDFDAPWAATDLDDAQFFEQYAEIVRDRIVKGMFPTDLSDFHGVQMVRDDWHPCGDFA